MAIVSVNVIDGITRLFRVDTDPLANDYDGEAGDWFFDMNNSYIFIKQVTGENKDVRPVGGNWPPFSVATAPATHVQTGDHGHCSDGKAGAQCLAYYDGAAWRCASTDVIISAV